MPTLAEFWPILQLSLLVSGMAVLFSSIVGVPIGVWLGLTTFPGQRLLAGLVRTGMALPPVVIGLLLYLLLSRTGPLGSWGWLYTPRAMVAAQTVLAFPFVVGITHNAISSIPRELAWQLRSLGASPSQCRWLILGEARQGVLLALAAAFGRSISEVGAVLIVGGNIAGHTRVLTTAIVLETSKGDFRFAILLGGVLLAVSLAVNLFILQFRDARRA